MVKLSPRQSATLQTAVNISIIGLIILVIVGAIMFGYPRYKVWQQEMITVPVKSTQKGLSDFWVLFMVCDNEL